MTKNEVRRFINKSIIHELGNSYKLIDNTFLIKYPIKEIVVGYCFEPSSVKDTMYPAWFAQPLYIPDTLLHLTFGGRLRIEGSEMLTTKGDEDGERSTMLLLQKIIMDNDFISKLVEPENFYNYFKTKANNNIRIHEAIVYTAFWLKKPSAKMELKSLINHIYKNVDTSILWVKELLSDLAKIENSPDPFKLLNQNRIDTLKKIKLE